MNKQNYLKKISKILRIITIILAIFVGWFMIDTFIIRGSTNNKLENPLDFYDKSTEIVCNNEIISISKIEIIVEKKITDINGNVWNTIYIPEWEIKLNIPDDLTLDDNITDNGESIILGQSDKYKLIVESRQLTTDELNIIEDGLNNLKKQSDRARLHLCENEKYLNSHVDFIVLDNAKLFISNFIENNKEFGYRYSLVRDNNILSIRCTQPIRSKMDILTLDTTYLRQIVNMITIVDKE
ncbi:MAG: hypothetical protein J6A59_12625 [Lachnospiraceae bacterium]|nr:hypothetical protein [Lachnospiraceae bacterium]